MDLVSKLRSLSPLLAIAVIAAAAVTLYCVLGLATDDPDPMAILWGVAATGVVACSVWGMAASGIVLKTESAYLSQKTRKMARIVLATFVAVVSGLVVKIDFSGAGGTKQLAHLPEHVGTVVLVANCFVAVTVLMMIAASCLLSTPPYGPRSGQEIDASLLARRSMWLAVLLHSAALLLVIGLVEIHTLYRWTAIIGHDNLKFTKIITVAAGSMFSLLLVAIFAPAGLIQSHWVNALVARELASAGMPDRDKWLAARGLGVSTLRLLGAGAALAMPAVTGTITAIFGR